MKIKNEKVFQYFMTNPVFPTEEGRIQFFEEQSKGIKPLNPDPYYSALCDGKRRFDFLTSEYRKNWLCGEWWGFKQLWKDWEGNRWILPCICSWYPSLKEKYPWLDKEINKEELLRLYGV